MRDVAQFFKLLSDEARLEILWLLFNHRELCVCDIMEALGITQSKASRHLGALRHAALVVDRKDGAWSHYSLRVPQSEFERDQLEFLRVRLVNHAGAVRMLRAFDEGLAQKDRKTSRAPDGRCGRTSQRSPTKKQTKENANGQ